MASFSKLRHNVWHRNSFKMESTLVKDWDDEFANMAHVEDSERFPSIWTEQAARYRKQLDQRSLQLDIRYGDAERERLDIILPTGRIAGLAIFVHGGYWMRLDKSYWTDFAEGARARGWAVCLPSYTLTPEVTIPQITTQIAAAIKVAAQQIEGPIRLAGHSAGGHLVTRMLCQDSLLGHEIQQRIEHVLSISGVHDLRPLLYTKLNDTLKLTDEDAALESPALLKPIGSTPLTTWVGGGERPEFIRQTKLMSMMWDGLNTLTNSVVDGEHNHFTVIEDLKRADSALTDAFVGSSNN